MLARQTEERAMPQRAAGLVLGVLGLLTLLVFVLARQDLCAAAARGSRLRRRLLASGLALAMLLGLPWATGCRADAQTKPGSGAGAGAGAGSGQSEETRGAKVWKKLLAVMAEAEEVASGKRGEYPFDAKGKKRLLDALDAGRRDVDDLAAAWSLATGEAELLKKALAWLATGVQAKRPTDMRAATCYEPMPAHWPMRQTMERLSARLPLLEKAAAAKRLRPEVLRKALVHVEEDLAVLEAKGSVDRLPPLDRKRAEELRDAVRAKVKQLRTKVADGK
jgi:hypothetical protein